MTAHDDMTHCPSDETLAAFIDGMLEGETRSRTIEHLAECGMCRETVLMADAVRSEPGLITAPSAPAVVRGRFGSRWPALVAAAALLALFGPILWYRVAPGHEIRELARATEELKHRTSRARFSGNSSFRSYEAPKRGDGPGHATGAAPDAARWKLLSVASKILEDAGRTKSASRLHPVGVAYLLLDEPKTAVAVFEQVLELETGEADVVKAIGLSTNAVLLNDLAAAYNTLVDDTSAVKLTPLALAAVQRAWAIERTPQIAFNRALILEKTGDRAATIQAWGDYLNLDPDSEWSVEARQELAELRGSP